MTVFKSCRGYFSECTSSLSAIFLDTLSLSKWSSFKFANIKFCPWPKFLTDQSFSWRWEAVLPTNCSKIWGSLTKIISDQRNFPSAPPEQLFPSARKCLGHFLIYWPEKVNIDTSLSGERTRKTPSICESKAIFRSRRKASSETLFRKS